MYYPFSENKGADQLIAKLICVFVFTFAKSRFSHNEAHMIGAYLYGAILNKMLNETLKILDIK